MGFVPCLHTNPAKQFLQICCGPHLTCARRARMAMDHTTGKPRLQLEIPKLSESIISVTAHSPAHTKVRHLSEDRPDTGCSFKGPDQLMSRPLLYTWMRYVQIPKTSCSALTPGAYVTQCALLERARDLCFASVPCADGKGVLHSCLDATLRPKLGDVYWWEEEQLTSLNTEKASYRARLILRVKSSGRDDCIMPWSSKMAVNKAAR